MIVLGILLLLLCYFLPLPSFLVTIGWIMIFVGFVLLVAEAIGHAIGPRRWYY